MTTTSDKMFQHTLAQVLRLRENGAKEARAKLSSPQPQARPTSLPAIKKSLMSKASQVYERNKDVEAIGQVLTQAGLTGLDKLASSSTGAGSSPGGSVGGGDSTIPLTQEFADVGKSTTDGLKDPVAEHTLKNQLLEGEGPTAGEYSDPVLTRSARGGEGHQLDQGDLSTAESTSGGVVVNFPGTTGKDLSSDKGDNDLTINDTNKTAGVKVSEILNGLTPDKELVDPANAIRALRQMNIHSPNDAFFVLKRSAINYGIRGRNDVELVQNFAKAASLNDIHGADAWWELLLRSKHSAEEAKNEVAAAKEVVEGVVKATGELPTAEQVAQAANVSPVAANVATYEIAELVAATGGQVAAPGQAAAMAPAPIPPGMMAPGPGAMPPPMGGAPGAPPPMDPSMMGGMPPGPGGMPPGPGGMPPAAPPGAPAPPPPGGMPVQASIHPARLFDAISRLAMMDLSKLSGTEPTISVTDEPQTGGKSNDEKVVPPSGFSASNTIQNKEKSVSTGDLLNAQDRAMISDTLSSNSAQVSTGPQDTYDSTTTHLDHDEKLGRTDGIIDGNGEQVRGRSDQDMADSSMKTSSRRRDRLSDAVADLGDDILRGLFPELHKRSMESELRDETDDLFTPNADPDEHEEGGDYLNADGTTGDSKTNDTTTTEMGSDTSESVFEGNW